MLHQSLIVVEIRQAESEQGWAQYEATGRVCIVCPCGLNTDWITTSDGAREYREHGPLAGRVIRHYPENAQAQTVVNEMIGDLMGEG
ncbi:hypothetical protein ACPCTG_26410 [Streptomyces pseudogriseolus]|uniref:hypothetical protein n=1 Tax=Streptomyces pseudogriseolus TaxID=36817 RepID=UPI003FA33CE7